MGYRLTGESFDVVLKKLSEEHVLFAPIRYGLGGRFSDTDAIRYGEIGSIAEIVFDEKSSHTFKEVLLPITQLLFYFTEDQVKEANPPAKGAIVFLRSCDLHAVKRLDAIYLQNGWADYYYDRVRDKIHFALIGCPEAFDSCFCVDMGTNRSDNYDFALTLDKDGYLVDCKLEQWQDLFKGAAAETLDVTPAYVTDTPTRVNIPDNLDSVVITKSSMWDEYDERCIACGRCNYSCPTCTCFTMQDVFYSDDGRAGERRRVWASCMVEGFTDVAGGGKYRKKYGERMRYKTLHKALDFKKAFGYQMCIGCGRCDDVCPEYISFSKILNNLDGAMKGGTTDGGK